MARENGYTRRLYVYSVVHCRYFQMWTLC